MDDTKTKACKEVFEAINERQLMATDFHCQMVSLFDFLNLPGLKAMHEYQFLSEALEHMKTKRYFLAHHQKLLRDGEMEYKRYIESDWFENDRSRVQTQMREQSVKEAINTYYEWEYETKDFLEQCINRLNEIGCASDIKMVNELLEDVMDELKHIDRLRIELDGVGYDSEYIFMIQDKLKGKYKEKVKEIPDIKRIISGSTESGNPVEYPKDKEVKAQSNTSWFKKY